MPIKIKEADLIRIIEQEIEDYGVEKAPDVQNKNKKIADVISKIYQMIMRGEIEQAKKALAADPEIQQMAGEVAKLTSDLGKKLKNDDNFLQHISKIVDEM